jgi:hypothetical protein
LSPNKYFLLGQHTTELKGTNQPTTKGYTWLILIRVQAMDMIQTANQTHSQSTNINAKVESEDPTRQWITCKDNKKIIVVAPASSCRGSLQY